MRHLDRDLKLLTAATLLFALDAGMYLQLLPVYALQLGSSPVIVGVLMAILLAATAAGNIPGAWAAQRFRLKPVIVFAWWLRVLAALLFFAAPSWPWLIPALIVSGLYMANNPAYKTYIHLKSEPQRVASNLTLVFGAYPLGLVVSPLVGGYLAERVGMRLLFLVAAAVFVVSALIVSLIRDTPYQTADTPFDLAALRKNRRFGRYVAFFLVAFLAAYIGQPFLNPYLEQVHHQGYAA